MFLLLASAGFADSQGGAAGPSSSARSRFPGMVQCSRSSCRTVVVHALEHAPKFISGQI